MAAKPCTKQERLFPDLLSSPPVLHCLAAFLPLLARTPFFLWMLFLGDMWVVTPATLSNIHSKEHVLVAGPSTGPCSLILTFHSIFGLTGLAESLPSPPPRARHSLWDS